MSFGWSVGDIVAALKLLHQITTALKDSGGASSEFQDVLSFLQTFSRTLQHLNALQSTNLDPDLAENLREQCEHIRTPLQAFLDDVKRRFEPGLGVNSRKHRILATPRKIQWALSMSTAVKKFQDRVAVPMAAVGLILGHQIVQITLQMPGDIQDRMSHALETAMQPPTTLINNQLEAISVEHATSTNLIARTIKETGADVVQAASSNASETREISRRLENGLNSVLRSQRESTDTITDVRTKLEDLLAAHSTSIALSNHDLQHTYQATPNTIQAQAFKDRTKTPGLDQKLGQVDASLGAIQNSLLDLSKTQLKMGSNNSRSELEAALQNILRSIWILLSSLHRLINELVRLLAPYMIVFYKNTVQCLEPYSDQFFFEDAIGRVKRLPCAQFQHWNIFYDFLVNSFQDTPGLSLVVRERFIVMNGYNSNPISREAWQSAIQPRSKVTMSMILYDIGIRKGWCVDPSCAGRMSITATETTRICSTCGKHISSIIAPSPVNFAKELEEEVHAKATTNLNATSMDPAGPVVHPVSEATSYYSSKKEIAAFKRIACHEEEDPVLYLISMNDTFEPKMIPVPYYPESLPIGRQTNQQTVPTSVNGFFDSKVLSRRHAEIWADSDGKVWIRDVGSTNGTWVNGTLLSAPNHSSEPHELQTQDHLELGIDLVSDDQKLVVFHKVVAKVQRSGTLPAIDTTSSYL